MDRALSDPSFLLWVGKAVRLRTYISQHSGIMTLDDLGYRDIRYFGCGGTKRVEPKVNGQYPDIESAFGANEPCWLAAECMTVGVVDALSWHDVWSGTSHSRKMRYTVVEISIKTKNYGHQSGHLPLSNTT